MKYRPQSASSTPKDSRGGPGGGAGNTSFAAKLQKAGADQHGKSGVYMWAKGAGATAEASAESDEELILG